MKDHWNTRFLSLAEHISHWSKDPKRQVGAIIVNPKTKQVMGMGYNGPPKRIDDSVLKLENKNDYIIHAEVNAILDTGCCKGYYLYIYPYLPCNNCAAVIINAGIHHVEVSEPTTNEKWRPQITLDLFRQAGVTVRCGNRLY